MPARGSRLGATKARLIRSTAAAFARTKRRPKQYRPGVTVVTVNWNSLPFLRAMIAATRAMSPSGTEIVVVDNASTDGSRQWLAAQYDLRVIELPVNVGHGAALDLAMPTVDTEYVAVLDIDAFPISDRWLQESIAALDAGAKITGAKMHRNFVHPCFLVTIPKVLHEFNLTFRPVGSLAKLSTEAPLFLDVAEAMSQRLIVKFGGGQAIHYFDITEARGTGVDGVVFGGLVYHNMFATQGKGREQAMRHWQDAMARFHPTIAEELWPAGMAP